MRLLQAISGAFAILGIACLAFVSGYMYSNYEAAEEELAQCQGENNTTCRIERNGVNYTVSRGSK